jgi:ABC-type multidrug transport system fused ATPase/permease subunit
VGRLLGLTISGLDRAEPGDLMSRVTSDTTLLRDVITDPLAGVVTGSLTLVATLVLMSLMDVVLFGGRGGHRGRGRGFGRGEWLALLRDAGVTASGVDANPAFVEAGRERGLDLVHVVRGLSATAGPPASDPAARIAGAGSGATPGARPRSEPCR